MTTKAKIFWTSVAVSIALIPFLPKTKLGYVMVNAPFVLTSIVLNLHDKHVEAKNL